MPASQCGSISELKYAAIGTPSFFSATSAPPAHRVGLRMNWGQLWEAKWANRRGLKIGRPLQHKFKTFSSRETEIDTHKMLIGSRVQAIFERYSACMILEISRGDFQGDVPGYSWLPGRLNASICVGAGSPLETDRFHRTQKTPGVLEPGA